MMNGTTDTKATKDTPTTPTRGESAVRHLWKRATEAGKEEEAALIAKVANLLQPDIKLTAGAPFSKPEKAKVDSAEVNGQAVDLSGMEDQDAADYAAYTRELDGTARLQRHVEQLEWEDEELARAEGMRHDGS